MPKKSIPKINQVALSGQIAEEPEVRCSEEGVASLRARLLVSRPYRDDKGDWQEETSSFDIVLVKKSAEYFAERLHKGIYVFVTGRLKSHEWKDREGNPYSQVEISVRNLQLLK